MTKVANIVYGGFILMLINCLLVSPFVAFAASSGNELIPNGNFEKVNAQGRPDGFSIGYMSGQAMIASDSTQIRSGSRSVRLVSDGNERPALAKTVEVTKPGAYRLSVWYKASKGIQGENVRVRLMAYTDRPYGSSTKYPWLADWIHDADEHAFEIVAGNFHLNPSENGPYDSWHLIEMDFTLPRGVVGLAVELFNQKGDGTIWYDDLSLTRLPEEDIKPIDSDTVSPDLTTLRTQRPRVMATGDDFRTIHHLISSDPFMQQWYDLLVLEAETIIGEPPATYEIPDGKRLLQTSRKVLARVESLAMMYRLTEDSKYMERLWQELDAAANFPDWNPRHFLDTAEMTRAFAIAYDWLYDRWTDEQRSVIRQSIVEKALEPGLMYYRETAPREWLGQWRPTTPGTNWNFVVNGGLTLGALAIAEEVPEIAEEIVTEAFRSVLRVIGDFGPDGAWREGMAYWEYSLKYLIPYMITLENALGSDFGLVSSPGIKDTGNFPIYLTSPTMETFNFGDAGLKVRHAPEMLWLSRRFNQPTFGEWYRRLGSPWGSLANSLLWHDPILDDEIPMEGLPLDHYFRGAEVITFRSDWEDPDATFVGFKGGKANSPHGDLDLGDFIVDAFGVRWATETGLDSYNLPGYSDRSATSGRRWTYYRNRAEGQNTLVINPGEHPDQNTDAISEIVFHASRPNEAVGIVDLTPAYSPDAHVQRGIALFDERRQVLVQDEITALMPAEVWWFMHTALDVELSQSGTFAVLRHGNKRMTARILSPSNARFSVVPARPLPSSPNPGGQNPNSEFKKLAIHLEDVTATRIVVQLTPLNGNELVTEAPAIIPLDEWTANKANHSLWTSYPRMTMNFGSLIRNEKLTGDVRIHVNTDIPDDVSVTRMDVFLGEHVVYSGSQLLDEIIFDSSSFDDGKYAFEVQLQLDHEHEVSHIVPVHTENRWVLVGEFVPPNVSEWFGTVDFSQTIDESPGWEYATDRPTDFFGDKNRRVWSGPSSGYLAWETPYLDRFTVTMYAEEEDMDKAVHVEGSADGEVWFPLSRNVEITDRSQSGNYLVVLSGKIAPCHGDVGFIRITIDPMDHPADKIQLGRVEFHGTHVSRTNK